MPLFSPQPKRDHTQNKNLWSSKLQLDFHASDDLLLFTGVNRSMKAGGFNAPFTFGAGFPAEDIPYQEEVLTSYETGFKWDKLFGGTTRINGSFYYYDYNNYQGFFFTQITGWVRDVDAEYKGAELEIFSSPTDNLDLSFNVSYIDAKIYDVQLGPGTFINAQPQLHADMADGRPGALQLTATGVGRFGIRPGQLQLRVKVLGQYP